MPTYDYICRACGHEFELFQQMSDPVKRKCPDCGKPKLERLIGIGAGVLFKGGGFYETDYRSDSYTKAAEADKKSAEAKPEAAKSNDGAADSKSAKPETKATDGKSEAKTSASSDASASEKKSSRRSIVKPSSPTPKRSKRK